MTSYIQHEAELSEGNESGSETSEPVAKKSKKGKEKKRRQQIRYKSLIEFLFESKFECHFLKSQTD